ncbi:hypothetical protein HU200_010070 [Digitaria exilis]|uniref:F-box domain-containing protein n=1 Tax=Digitaria exilis TaxID=1010633 RepID=A0A835KNW8_9POAL|nr:hypothetical protein HU200_010070 [Digitaria exilis]
MPIHFRFRHTGTTNENNLQLDPRSDDARLQIDPASPPPRRRGIEARSRSTKKRRVWRSGIRSGPLYIPAGALQAKILARVPYRSLCRFKSVSRSWRAICSDPATLAGFFFRTVPLGGRPSPYVRHFVNASGRGTPMVDPSLSFLPLDQRNACILDSCNGILLCKGDGSRYFVCNPATENGGAGGARAPNPHHPVFVVVEGPETSDQLRNHVTRVEIYSSETGAWTHRQSDWLEFCLLQRHSAFDKPLFFVIAHGGQRRQDVGENHNSACL